MGQQHLFIDSDGRMCVKHADGTVIVITKEKPRG